MTINQRVRVVSEWSSFCGMTATVTATHPHLMITVDDDPRPIRVGANEIVPIPDEPQHTKGAP